MKLVSKIVVLSGLLCAVGCGLNQNQAANETLDGVEATAEFIPADESGISCGGTEPFWHFEPGTQNGSMAYRFTSPENLDGTVYPVVKSGPMLGTTAEYAFGVIMKAGEAGQVATLSVVQGECSDGMSDNVYPYKGVFFLNSNFFQGCCGAPRAR